MKKPIAKSANINGQEFQNNSTEGEVVKLNSKGSQVEFCRGRGRL